MSLAKWDAKMKQELYCNLFIASHESIEQLGALVNMYLKGEKQGLHSFRTSLLEFDLRQNNKYLPDSDLFLHWSYYADIETDNEQCHIEHIRGLVTLLRPQGILFQRKNLKTFWPVLRARFCQLSG